MVTEDTRHIHKYYSPDGLYGKILDGLNSLGKNLDNLTPDDLQPVDEFHIRGDKATRELIRLAAFTPDMHILDVGCGIGGSTRRLAHETGCRVTGIDLSDEYIDTAIKLTQLLGMGDRVDFHACSALDLPFEDDMFDGVWSLQMNMNVRDKPGWLQETWRVLKPGGRAVLYEVCGGNDTPLQFPVPWAQDASMSYLVPPEEFRALVSQSGFVIESWRDRTPLAREAFAGASLPHGEPVLPALGVWMLAGRDIQTKAWNLHLNLDAGCVSLIECLAIKPA